MSPTMVYNEFIRLFPGFKVSKYYQVKEDHNMIKLEDQSGYLYLFRYLSDDCWDFKTINYKERRH